MSTRNIFWG